MTDNSCRGAVLVIPACESGRGSGHIIRCMNLVSALRSLGREAWLHLPFNRLIDNVNFNHEWLITDSGLQNINFDCIVLDRFKTLPGELKLRNQTAIIIGIDEGGKYRSHFDFLIDILPNLCRHKPNITDISLLPLPEKLFPEAKSPEKVNSILISFGQEDTAGLGFACAEALSKKNNGSVKITLINGYYSKNPAISIPQCSIIDSVPHLNEHLGEYGLIITHFGLTAFEALYANVLVLLVSPTGYHEKLAKKAGFLSVGTGRRSAKKTARLLFTKSAINFKFIDKLKKRCDTLAVQFKLNYPPRQSLAELINSYTPDLNRNCSACGSELDMSVLARFAERSYRRCPYCGVINMGRLNLPPIEYSREYFFEMYQKQYGKTYIEDFPNLIKMAKRRLAVIQSLNPHGRSTKLSLLDIGCAYGPFLAAAQKEGFSPFGIDPAEDAVNYVTQTLCIPAVHGFFPSVLPSSFPDTYSVITLWYVIEHFRDCLPALDEIHKLLEPGGIIAFATPSFSGISGRSSLNRFLERSPADHWTVWFPSACKKALKSAGFKVKKIVISGHHPERFPVLGKFASGKDKPLYRLLLALSKIFSFGDTFEVYAVKE